MITKHQWNKVMHRATLLMADGRDVRYSGDPVSLIKMNTEGEFVFNTLSKNHLTASKWWAEQQVETQYYRDDFKSMKELRSKLMVRRDFDLFSPILKNIR